MAEHEHERDPLDPDIDPLGDVPAGTQSMKPSSRKYAAVFLFHFDLDNEKPFSSVSLEHFEGTDFPFELISGPLSMSERLKPRELSRLPGSRYCIFAKCEQGRSRKTNYQLSIVIFEVYWPLIKKNILFYIILIH